MYKISDNIIISFKLTVFIILIVFSIIMIAFFLLLPDYREHIIFITSTIGGAGAIYSAIYVGIGLKSQYIFNRMTNSFELMKRYEELDFAKMRATLETKYDKENLSQKELKELLKNDEKFRVAIKSTFNYFEDLSLAIQTNYADEKILFWSIEAILREFYHNYNFYIKESSNNYNEKDVYIETRKLVSAWEKEIYLSKQGNVKIEPIQRFKKSTANIAYSQ